MDSIYLCYKCFKQVDKDGYIELNMEGMFICHFCKSTYNYKNLIKKSILILTYSNPTSKYA
jgi:hypothetical protein